MKIMKGGKLMDVSYQTKNVPSQTDNFNNEWRNSTVDNDRSINIVNQRGGSSGTGVEGKNEMDSNAFGKFGSVATDAEYNIKQSNADSINDDNVNTICDGGSCRDNPNGIYRGGRRTKRRRKRRRKRRTKRRRKRRRRKQRTKQRKRRTKRRKIK